MCLQQSSLSLSKMLFSCCRFLNCILVVWVIISYHQFKSFEEDYESRASETLFMHKF